MTFVSSPSFGVSSTVCLCVSALPSQQPVVCAAQCFLVLRSCCFGPSPPRRPARAPSLCHLHSLFVANMASTHIPFLPPMRRLGRTVHRMLRHAQLGPSSSVVLAYLCPYCPHSCLECEESFGRVCNLEAEIDSTCDAGWFSTAVLSCHRQTCCVSNCPCHGPAHE